MSFLQPKERAGLCSCLWIEQWVECQRISDTHWDVPKGGTPIGTRGAVAVVRRCRGVPVWFSLSWQRMESRMCAEGEVPETVGLLEAEGSSTWAGGWGGSCWTAWKREQGTYLTAALMSLGERLPRCGNVDMPSILPPGCTVHNLLNHMVLPSANPSVKWWIWAAWCLENAFHWEFTNALHFRPYGFSYDLPERAV